MKFVSTILAAILLLVLWQSAGPAPEPANAPPSHFSARRAVTTLYDLLGSTADHDKPHPVGSAAHDAVLQRVAAHFDLLGYETQLQHSFACNASGICAPVTNLIARKPGETSHDAVMLTAHYDSVPAGPGASDDGTGVATLLEIARATRSERFANPVVFLVDDAEEVGLLGAEAFDANPDASRGIVAAINVDNRGSSGRSFLFETSRMNRWLIPIVAGALPRPSTSSLFYTVYELLPNDTDMTVFKRDGRKGVNFGNIGNVAYYHTPLDNFAHVDPRTVQDHGDHALAMLRALGNADLTQRSDQNAVYFDVLGLFTVWWPEGWSVWMAVLMLAIAIIATALLVRESRATFGGIALGIVSFVVALVIAGVAGVIVQMLSTLRAGEATWVAHPLPAIAAVWLAGIAAAVAGAAMLRHRAGFDGLLTGYGVAFSGIAIALALTLPGVSYLFLVPAIALSLSALLRATTNAGEVGVTIACAVVTAVLFFPLGTVFYVALGKPALTIIALLLALAASAFAPLASMHARAVIATSFSAALLLTVIGIVLPTYSSDSPRHLSMSYLLDSDSGKTSWLVPTLTPALGQAATFASSTSPWEWYANPSKPYSAPAPDARLAPVSVETSEVAGATRVLNLHVHSNRGAQRVAVMFHTEGNVDSIHVDGAPLPPPGPRFYSPLAKGWHRVVVRAGEAIVTVALPGARTPIELIAADYSYGLPEAGRALQAARDASTAVPSDDGDMTITTHRVQIAR